jgi:hypothetical protein
VSLNTKILRDFEIDELQPKASPFKAGMRGKAYKFSHFDYSLVMS